MIGRNVLLFENGKKGKITPPYSTVPILNRVGLCLRADLDNKESFTNSELQIFSQEEDSRENYIPLQPKMLQYLVVTYLDNKFKNHSKLKVHKKDTKYILHNRDTSSIPTQCQFKTSCHCPCTILCHCRFKWIIILCELQRHGSCTPMDYKGIVQSTKFCTFIVQSLNRMYVLYCH